MEGTNNKIKTLNRQAYGYRDEEFFILKLLGLHESSPTFATRSDFHLFLKPGL